MSKYLKHVFHIVHLYSLNTFYESKSPYFGFVENKPHFQLTVLRVVCFNKFILSL